MDDEKPEMLPEADGEEKKHPHKPTPSVWVVPLFGQTAGNQIFWSLDSQAKWLYLAVSQNRKSRRWLGNRSEKNRPRTGRQAGRKEGRKGEREEGRKERK